VSGRNGSNVVVMARRVPGVEDLVEDGCTGYFVEPTSDSVSRALARIAAGGPPLDAVRRAARTRTATLLGQGAEGWRLLMRSVAPVGRTVDH
jgi:glycosyltransferase involved in cell wall biosynthesis